MVRRDTIGTWCRQDICRCKLTMIESGHVWLMIENPIGNIVNLVDDDFHGGFEVTIRRLGWIETPSEEADERKVGKGEEVILEVRLLK